MSTLRGLELEDNDIILSKKFYKKLTNEKNKRKRDLIINKMKSFEAILLESKSKSDIPKAIWIRKIMGTEIYKFRVNSGDRILFQYAEVEDENKILFIDFCNHDSQIRTAKNQGLNISFVGFEIDDRHEYEEDELDKEIDEEINNEIFERLEVLKQNSVIEDEYISVSIEDDHMEFLSLEQYECISNRNKQPSLIFGCAGSGKTVIAIRKLILNHEENLKSIYITCSNMIVDRAKDIYYRFLENDTNASFYTLRDLCFQIIGFKSPIVIEYKDFYQWFLNYALVKEYKDKVDIREIWVEIFSLIKGTSGKKQNSKELEGIISEDEYYNCKESHYDLKNRKIIYRIARIYQYWLKNNRYYDDNDLAELALRKISSEHKYDYVIYDEIQDLTERQIALIYSIARNKNNIMLIGDINQTLNISKLNLDSAKNMAYEYNSKFYEKFIIKNYRNGSKTINLINALKQLEFSKFRSIGKIFEQQEEHVKEGLKPSMIYNVKMKVNFLSSVEDNVNSIIIVPDEIDKKELSDMGYELGRVFSVDSVRGLEYENIYCYNILSKFNNIWDKILSNNSKLEDIYKIYFNMVYIAITRAKNKVIFIEKTIPVLDTVLSEYWNKINFANNMTSNTSNSNLLYNGFIGSFKVNKSAYLNMDESISKLFEGIKLESRYNFDDMDLDLNRKNKSLKQDDFKKEFWESQNSIADNIDAEIVRKLEKIRSERLKKAKADRISKEASEWGEEAEKLEKTENYYQAAYAYKKAGRKSDEERCIQKIHARNINFK